VLVAFHLFRDIKDNSMTGKKADSLLKTLGYKFKNPELLAQALTHSSWSNEHPGEPCNERLEFLGDAVLGIVIAEILFEHFGQWDEGKLTAGKSYLVGKENLEKIAMELNLFDYLNLGEGEKRCFIRSKNSLSADAFEALIGAIFLDGGIDSARKILKKLFGKYIAFFEKEGIPVDPKSRLQEISLQRYGKLPVYKMSEETGPDHAKEFVYSVKMPDGTISEGRGRTKKEAQRNAAENLLRKLE